MIGEDCFGRLTPAKTGIARGLKPAYLKFHAMQFQRAFHEDIERGRCQAAMLNVLAVYPLDPWLLSLHSAPQLTAAKRNTLHAASSEMAVDIFESPSRRSVKTMGTSLIVNPCFHAVWCSSIWNA